MITRRWLSCSVPLLLAAARFGGLAALAARLFGLRAHDARAASPGMQGGMMGGGGDMMQMMMPDNMASPMQTGMQLFMRHAEIRRTVTVLPDGVRAVTESDDAATASLIQAHVGDMYRRVDEGQAFPYPMSRSVPAMFAHRTAYRRKLEATPKGIIVTETADDPAMVAVIHAHAREIDGFVRDGMPAMMRGMMRQRG
jgi:hypothetical protein